MNPSHVIGRKCSDIFKNLPRELNVGFGDLAIIITKLSDASKVFHGESLAYFRLTISQTTLADVRVSNAASERGFGAAGNTFRDIVMVRIDDFQTERSPVDGGLGFRNVMCRKVSVRKSVFEDLNFDRVKISDQLVIERCSANAISITGLSELNNLILRGRAEADIVFDFKNVKLSKTPNQLIVPASMYPAVERLQQNS